MNWEQLQWQSPTWLIPAGILAAVAAVVLVVSYARSRGYSAWAWVAAGIKALVFALLLLCLLDPTWVRQRPKPGENLVVLLADNSQSMQLHDVDVEQGRGPAARELLLKQGGWQDKIEKTFDLRFYRFDAQMQSVESLDSLQFDGQQSQLYSALRRIGRRHAGKPVAGIVLLSDGIATDELEDFTELQDLPPVYPVIAGDAGGMHDLSIEQVAVSQTNFEAAPITMRIDVAAQGYRGLATIEIVDDQQQVVASQSVVVVEDEPIPPARLQVKPDKSGILVYQVRVQADEDLGNEATLENNRQLLVVDRGGGPYRVLYVAGRPNWEYKFIRRAVFDDQEVKLVSLLRVAKQEPKFDFRGRDGEVTNPIYRGFGDEIDEAEDYDQPVLVTLDAIDDQELRDGFPKSREELFKYHALIVDDLESEFFTQDQMSMIQEFVSHRGGGFMMLGGQESLTRGGYDRTPIGEMLPVYVQREIELSSDDRFAYALSREGWLEPWLRLRATETEEKKRLVSLPPSWAIHGISAIKPGASLLATVATVGGDPLPAVASQPFGQGRVVACMLADVWRWGMEREEGAPRDMEASWRQTLRWLTADVPQSIDVEVADDPDSAGSYRLMIDVRDETYQPFINAQVKVTVHTPEDRDVVLDAEPAVTREGRFECRFAPAQPGAYQATIEAFGLDGQRTAQRKIGWAHQPALEEFADLTPRTTRLQELAERTGGRVIEPREIMSLVKELPERAAPVMERSRKSIWHQWWILALALTGLGLEWGIRRWQGLA